MYFFNNLNQIKIPIIPQAVFYRYVKEIPIASAFEIKKISK